MPELTGDEWNAVLMGLPTKRRCDGCDVCCSAVGVEEISKPPGVRCSFQKDDGCAGCSIYGQHPESCKSFACLWRVTEDLPEGLFPAKCGFVVTIPNGMARPMLITVHPDPARPKAWDTLYYRGVFADLARRGNAIVVVGQGHLASTIFAPSGRVYTKAGHPQFFINGGESIGLPDYDFVRPVRRGR